MIKDIEVYKKPTELFVRNSRYEIIGGIEAIKVLLENGSEKHYLVKAKQNDKIVFEQPVKEDQPEIRLIDGRIGLFFDRLVGERERDSVDAFINAIYSLY